MGSGSSRQSRARQAKTQRGHSIEAERRMHTPRSAVASSSRPPCAVPPPQLPDADRPSPSQPPARTLQRQLLHWLRPSGQQQPLPQQQQPSQRGRSPQAAPLTTPHAAHGGITLPRGAINLGNTCYLSALMQCLASVSLAGLPPPRSGNSTLEQLFVQAIKDLRAQDTAPLLMEPLWREITRRQPSFKDLLQQDLFECWQLLASLNFLKALFSITKRSITCCGLDHEGCGFSAEAVDSANVWGLPLPPSGWASDDCLDEAMSKQLTQVQRLTGWRCPCCGALGAKQRVVDCATSPCLFLQVHRFEAGPLGPRKLHHPFPIPLNGMRLAPLRHGIFLDKLHYRLVGAIMHEGEIAGGHYWAVAKRHDGWYRFNDSLTTGLGTDFPSGLEPLVYGLLFQQALH